MRRFIFLFIVVLSPLVLRAQKILEVQSLDREININPYFTYYIDESSELDIDSIAELDTSSWNNISESGLRIGLTEATVWLKLSVVGLDYDPEQVVIDFVDQSIGRIELFEIRQSGRTSNSLTGSSISPEIKDVKGNRNNFLVNVDPAQFTDLYFKIKSPNYMTLSATVEDDAKALSDNTTERTFLGLFYGALIILILYNLLLFLTTRFRVFVFYALYILFVSLYTGAFDGFTSQYFFFLIKWTNGYQDIITGTMTHVLALLFMKDFLNIPSWSAKINRFVKWIIAGIGTVILLALIIYPSSGYLLLNIINLYVIVTLLLIGWIALKANVPQAIYFFMAYLLFGIFIVMSTLSMMGLIPFSLLIKYAIHVGFIISTLILSYGLGVRIYNIYQSLIREEKNKQLLVEQKNKELEEKVRERTADILHKETNLRAILDNSDSSIWLIDIGYKLIDFNIIFDRAWKLSYGYNLQRGKSLLNLFPDEEVSLLWQKRYDDILSGQRTIYRDEYKVDNSLRHYEIYGFPIEEKGEIKGASFFSKDITERVNAENQLVEQNEMLKKVNKELDSFVYSASHDLKAPLASVMGLINLVKYEEGIEKRQAYYEMMSNSISRLNQSIKDIIDFSRNARLEINDEPIDIAEMFNTIFEDLQYIEGADKISKHINIDKATIIKTDPSRLRVILRNLMSNAIQYGCLESKDKRIDIKVNRIEDIIKISITDYGPGIPKIYHERIFDMFYRANESSSGTGLGLYIVKETVEKLKGTVTMLSEEGKGSSFIIEIPFVK